MPNTVRRALVHALSGLSIVVAAYFLPRVWFLASLGAPTLAFLVFDMVRLRSPRVNAVFLRHCESLVREQEASRLTGAAYLLVGSLAAFLAFPRDIAMLAVGFLAVGDPIATIVGTYRGRTLLLGRTPEGDLACLLSCIPVALAFHYAGFDVRLPAALAGAVFATLAQAVHTPVNDNLTMPLLAGFVMWLMAF